MLIKSSIQTSFAVVIFLFQLDELLMSLRRVIYSEISIQETPSGPGAVSLEYRCPLNRDVTL